MDNFAFLINKKKCLCVLKEYMGAEWKEFNEKCKERKKANDHHINAGEYFINRHYHIFRDYKTKYLNVHQHIHYLN
jgi:hypothetical protein